MKGKVEQFVDQTFHRHSDLHPHNPVYTVHLIIICYIFLKKKILGVRCIENNKIKKLNNNVTKPEW